jgi:hypothetical protein
MAVEAHATESLGSEINVILPSTRRPSSTGSTPTAGAPSAASKQLEAFVDRSRGRRRDVAGDAPGKRELGEELPEPGFILADVRVDLALGALEVGIPHQRRPAVTGTSDIEHVQVILLDNPVQVNVNEILARTAGGGINTYIFDHTLAERPRATPPLCRREARS